MPEYDDGFVPFGPDESVEEDGERYLQQQQETKVKESDGTLVGSNRVELTEEEKEIIIERELRRALIRKIMGVDPLKDWWSPAVKKPASPKKPTNEEIIKWYEENYPDVLEGARQVVPEIRLLKKGLKGSFRYLKGSRQNSDDDLKVDAYSRQRAVQALFESRGKMFSTVKFEMLNQIKIFQGTQKNLSRDFQVGLFKEVIKYYELDSGELADIEELAEYEADEIPDGTYGRPPNGLGTHMLWRLLKAV